MTFPPRFQLKSRGTLPRNFVAVKQRARSCIQPHLQNPPCGVQFGRFRPQKIPIHLFISTGFPNRPEEERANKEAT